MTFQEVRPRDYKAVLCIGGRAPEYLRNDPRVHEILREFDQQGAWLLAICHGVQLPAAAGLLRGKNVTCYEHVRLEVEASGGTYLNKKVVRDGRLISAPTWREHPDFYREVFSCLSAEA